jgi:hypothetical protein
MHWILIGIGLIILRLTEPMFGMFLSEISWFVFSGLFIYLGFALNNLQTAIRELQIRQRELLLELKRVSKTTMRAVQTLDYSMHQASKNAPEDPEWIDGDDEIHDESPADIANSLEQEEWESWLADDPDIASNIFKDMRPATPPPSPNPPSVD